MDEDEPSPDDLALVRERSELRGRLAADQDQIRAECFEQQVLKLQHERGQAEVRAAEAENRFAEASSNLKALEQVRAQEKREFEIELRLWDDERQILTDRIQQHALQLGSDSLKSLQGPLRPRTLGHSIGQRALDRREAGTRGILVHPR